MPTKDRQWMLAAQDNFLNYLEEKDFEMARACIQDVSDAGFLEEAGRMVAKLKDVRNYI